MSVLKSKRKPSQFEVFHHLNKLKKLAGRLPEKEFYNLYHSWMENHYRIMSRQQRANMNDLYNKLKEEHYHVQTDFG